MVLENNVISFSRTIQCVKAQNHQRSHTAELLGGHQILQVKRSVFRDKNQAALHVLAFNLEAQEHVNVVLVIIVTNTSSP